jgi:hypothetical protein
VAGTDVMRTKITVNIFHCLTEREGREVSVYNVYITNQFQTTFARGGGGGVVKSVVEVNVIRRESLKTFVLFTYKTPPW